MVANGFGFFYGAEAGFVVDERRAEVTARRVEEGRSSVPAGRHRDARDESDDGMVGDLH